LLDRSAPGAIGNGVALLVVGFVIGAEMPDAAHSVWLAAMAGAIAGLLLWVVVTRRHAAAEDAAATTRRLRWHVVFATLIGAAWGVPSLLFGGDLVTGHALLMTVIVLSSTAACCAALGVYLPAFWSYCLTATLPLALALFRRHDSESQWLAGLVLLYIPTLGAVTFSYNSAALSALRLRAQNEELAKDLATSQAVAAAATRSKWDTLAHLSHELRTPMNAVIGFSDVMRQELFGALGQRYRTYSEDIHTSGHYALDLIDAILEATRAEAGRITLAEETIDTSAFLAESLRMVEPTATERNIALTSHIDGLPALRADEAKLRQVLLNLLTNAVRYTPAGGHVELAARCSDAGLEIAVGDTGIGIAAEDVARCFEPFVRLSNPLTQSIAGIGLGLSIAKRLIEAHDGTIGITSAPGHGTTVTLRLPPERCLALPSSMRPSLVA